MKSATCYASHCFCEGPYKDNAVMQPMNTYSAFAMLVVAFLVYRRAKSLAWDRFFRNVYVGALLLLWLGTMFFHATLTELGEWSDGMGLYAVIIFVPVYFFRCRFTWSRGRFALVYLAAVLAAGVFAFNFMQFRLTLFGVLVAGALLAVLLLGRSRVEYRSADLARTVGCFVVGLVFQILDNTLMLCSRYSLWQGHALWHVMAALAMYFLAELLMHLRLKTADGSIDGGQAMH